MHRRVYFSISLLCLAIFSINCSFISVSHAQVCGEKGIAVQVLGSGGPELEDKRASSSYLVWKDGQARVVVDTGSGSSLRFGESGAQMSQVDLILFSHFHVDHSADFPALIFSSWFEGRQRPLPVYGPKGDSQFPSMVGFVNAFINNPKAVYRYLSGVLAPQDKGSYELQPHNVAVAWNMISTANFRNEDLSVYSAQVIHGAVPSLAWRIEIGGKSIAFSGDTNGEGTGLIKVAKNVDLFIAHNAIPEGATGIERWLHMPPSKIGQIAQKARVKKLVLSHQMLRTLGKEKESLAEIRKSYAGPVAFANDLDCYPIP